MPKEDDGFEKFYEQLKDRNEAFFKVLLGQDDLGLVVRAHTKIEHELREFIISAAPSPDQVDFKKMDFDEEVRLALVLGLDKTLMPALTRIGNLRNKFAHSSDMKISEIVSKSLFDTLTPQASSRLKSAIKASIEAVPKGLRLEDQKRTRIEVILYFLEIRASLLEEQHRVEKKN